MLIVKTCRGRVHVSAQSEHRYDLYTVGFPAVAREMPQLNEGLVAQRALVRPFFRVRPLVVLEIRGIHKLLSAGSTHVRSLSRVPPLMDFKAA